MNSNDIELESFLHNVITEISKLNAPIVFKGGLALKDLLYMSNPKQKIERRTIDIDANWTGDIDEKEIFKVLETAIKKVEPTYSLKCYRMASEHKSMGFEIIDDMKEIITKIDLDIKDNPFYVIFTINNTNIKYSSIEKILADKLFALSGTKVFRRGKDLLDVYLIISDNDLDLDKIKDILKYDNRKLDNFKTMIDNEELMKKAYDSLRGITNKPDFAQVWNKVIEYLKINNLITNK